MYFVSTAHFDVRVKRILAAASTIDMSEDREPFDVDDDEDASMDEEDGQYVVDEDEDDDDGTDEDGDEEDGDEDDEEDDEGGAKDGSSEDEDDKDSDTEADRPAAEHVPFLKSVRKVVMGGSVTEFVEFMRKNFEAFPGAKPLEGVCGFGSVARMSSSDVARSSLSERKADFCVELWGHHGKPRVVRYADGEQKLLRALLFAALFAQAEWPAYQKTAPSELARLYASVDEVITTACTSHS